MLTFYMTGLDAIGPGVERRNLTVARNGRTIEKSLNM
jgi:hypothetical protein